MALHLPGKVGTGKDKGTTPIIYTFTRYPYPYSYRCPQLAQMKSNYNSRTHTGEKPYKCRLGSDASFSWSASRAKHERSHIHSGELVFAIISDDSEYGVRDINEQFLQVLHHF